MIRKIKVRAGIILLNALLEGKTTEEAQKEYDRYLDEWVQALKTVPLQNKRNVK